MLYFLIQIIYLSLYIQSVPVREKDVLLSVEQLLHLKLTTRAGQNQLGDRPLNNHKGLIKD